MSRRKETERPHSPNNFGMQGEAEAKPHVWREFAQRERRNTSVVPLGETALVSVGADDALTPDYLGHLDYSTQSGAYTQAS